MRQNFDGAEYSQFVDVDEGLYTSLPHEVSAATENIERDFRITPAKGIHQLTPSGETKVWREKAGIPIAAVAVPIVTLVVTRPITVTADAKSDTKRRAL